jgi:uncharacterized membrane protein
VLWVLLLPLSAILIFDFGVVPAVCYYLFILLFQFVSFAYLQMKHILEKTTILTGNRDDFKIFDSYQTNGQ